jgi:hypothetical protein
LEEKACSFLLLAGKPEYRAFGTTLSHKRFRDKCRERGVARLRPLASRVVLP